MAVHQSPISPLRQKMIDDMTVRRMSEGTQKQCVSGCVRFATYFGKSPEHLGPGGGRPGRLPSPAPQQNRTCGFPASYVADHIRCVMWRGLLCGEIRPSLPITA